MMKSVQKEHGPRWCGLSAEGNQIVFIGADGHKWSPPGLKCETPAEAEHIVRELKSWSKSAIGDAEYNRLCRAGD